MRALNWGCNQKATKVCKGEGCQKIATLLLGNVLRCLFEVNQNEFLHSKIYLPANGVYHAHHNQNENVPENGVSLYRKT